MASSDLSGELSCSICLCIYTNPVMLSCGHNFCEDCIANTWVRLRVSGNYSCPECRAEFETRPVLQKNLKLCNIVEHYRSSQKNTEEPEIFCTYCVSTLLPAVKTCLRCEASFCELHLKNHSKSTNHTLVEPLNTLEERKCPVHNEFIKYFCVRDSSLLCTSCAMSWKYKGHETELLSEASTKAKVRLTEFTKKLSSKTDMVEKSFWGLEEDRNNFQKQVADLKERVTNIFGDIRTELNDLENKALEEITKQETSISVSYSEQIQRLDKQIHEMYKEKRHIEEVCKITDPLMFLKQCAINTDLEQESPFKAEDLNIELINVTLMRALYKLSHIIQEQKKKYDLGDSSDMILNVNTANNYIGLSYDLKKATITDKEKSRSNHSDRFTTQQVLSSKRITSGKHYWEIQTSDYGEWSVGVTYNNVKRKGDCSLIGSNLKSWCLTWNDEDSELTADHDDESYDVDTSVESPDIGIYLDYDGGVISFYELSDSFQHLYTFWTNFTKPIYAGFYLHDNAWIKIAS